MTFTYQEKNFATVASYPGSSQRNRSETQHSHGPDVHAMATERKFAP